MTGRYNVRIIDPDTSLTKAVFDNWRSLTYRKRVNDFGSYTFVMDGKDDRKSLFTTDTAFNVWRSDLANGVDWYSDFYGWHRTPRDNVTVNGLQVFTSYGRDTMDFLARRALAYKAPYQKSGLATTVMGELVEENLGASALTTNGRIKDGALPDPVAIDTTTFIIGGPPPNWEGSRAYKNLLEVLQEIAAASHVDFLFSPNVVPGFILRTFYPHAGIDRTDSSPSPTIFSVGFGNVAVPDYTISRTEEVTSVIVAGEGVDALRTVVVRQSDARNDSRYNDIELVRDARGEGSVPALELIGDAELASLAAKENLIFEVIQTPGCLLGRDYNLGDLVTFRFGDIQRDKKIIGVDITVSEGKEKINLEFGDLETVRLDNGNVIKALSRRLHSLEHGGDV